MVSLIYFGGLGLAFQALADRGGGAGRVIQPKVN